MAYSKRPENNNPAKAYITTVRSITPEARKKMIAEKTYELAQQRGFMGDCQLHDWLEAEAKIDRVYGKAE